MQSSILGLNNTLREKILEPLAQYRGSDATPGRDATLKDFCSKHKINDGAGNPLDLPALFTEFQVNPITLTLGHLLTLAGDVKYLAPEVIRDFIVRGIKPSARYQDLCMGSANVSSMDIVSPWIDFEHPTVQPVNEAETIPQSQYTWGTKRTNVRKTGISLYWSDELILSVTFPILRRWMERVGMELNAKLYTDCVTTIINGDQTDGSDAAPVIGTATGNSLTFSDFVNVWVRSQLIGYRWSSIITNEAMSNYILGISEFKPTIGALGSAVVNIDSRDRIVPNSLPHFTSSAVSDNQVVLFDPSQAALYCVFRPLLVETERIIQRQVQGSVVSVMSAFISVQRMASIVMDKSKAFSPNYGFPKWLEPLT